MTVTRRSFWVRPTSSGILRSAERVFARDGYADTSLRRLIAEAGVSTTAFYARFPSKEAVLDALIAELLSELYEATTKTLSDAAGLEDGFEQGVEVLVKVLADRRDLVRLALTEAASSETSRATLQSAYEKLAALLSARVGGLAERGEADVADPDAFGWALVGALQMQVMRWAVHQDIETAGLADALRATARSLLPAVVRR